MNLPAELQPTNATEIHLTDGAVVSLPTSHPKFSPWTGTPIDFSYGNKPVVNYNGDACFTELVILRLLMANGWDGVWVETYGGTHYLRSMPKEWSLKSEHVSIPSDKERILEDIWKKAKTTACFDVFVWNDDQILFCEAKRSGKDKLTGAQIRFIEGALSYGIRPEAFLIVEWNEES